MDEEGWEGREGERGGKAVSMGRRDEAESQIWRRKKDEEQVESRASPDAREQQDGSTSG